MNGLTARAVFLLKIHSPDDVKARPVSVTGAASLMKNPLFY
jgi:hypothetical protein